MLAAHSLALCLLATAHVPLLFCFPWVQVMEERDAAQQLYPVSVDFEPAFDLLTHRLGHGERQSGADVGAALTTHGSWQPSVQPSRRPSLVDAVVGSLGGTGSKQNVLVDVGAGYGLLSLAAAARGHRVHAFELGPASLEALEASIQHNGFEHLVQVCRWWDGTRLSVLMARVCGAMRSGCSNGASCGSVALLRMARQAFRCFWMPTPSGPCSACLRYTRRLWGRHSRRDTPASCPGRV